MMNHHPPIIGCSAPVEKLREEIDQIACSDLAVMIRGERGTGKDVVAREIHFKSDRAAGPLVRVNCGGLPEELVESELFGCMKGAYTGAQDRPGKFELANGGTIFLDELGELCKKAQAKLLHVTENHAVDRIGGRMPIPVDFRLIVATNCNLEEMARSGTFRDDLYDRLNTVSIWVPPLRDRLDDIPLLVEYFIGECASEAKRMLAGATPQVLDLFHQYWWPGNVRELRNLIRRCVFTCKTEWIGKEDLPPDFGQRSVNPPPIKLGKHDDQLRDYSRWLMSNALQQAQGNRSKAAVLLGLTRNRFYRLLKAHGLDGETPEKRPPEWDWLRD